MIETKLMAYAFLGGVGFIIVIIATLFILNHLKSKKYSGAKLPSLNSENEIVEEEELSAFDLDNFDKKEIEAAFVDKYDNEYAFKEYKPSGKDDDVKKESLLQKQYKEKAEAAAARQAELEIRRREMEEKAAQEREEAKTVQIDPLPALPNIPLPPPKPVAASVPVVEVVAPLVQPEPRKRLSALEGLARVTPEPTVRQEVKPVFNYDEFDYSGLSEPSEESVFLKEPVIEQEEETISFLDANVDELVENAVETDGPKKPFDSLKKINFGDTLAGRNEYKPKRRLEEG